MKDDTQKDKPLVTVLVLASFGWATFVGLGMFTSLNAHSKESDTKFIVLEDKVNKETRERLAVNQAILISLTRIETKLGIKDEVPNDRR